MGTRLVGRVAEVVTLDRLRAAAVAGRGAVALLTGEAGIGKTAVVEEAVARASAAGTTVLTGRADPRGGLRPLLTAARWHIVVSADTYPGVATPAGVCPADNAHTREPVDRGAHREVMHHGGEICLLRDLYRAGMSEGRP
jgi:hypothetical protein